MTGGTIAHDQITFDLRTALAARLAGTPCRPPGPKVKIIADGRARYPDAIVVCRPVSPTATVADDPVVVFEVLSEGSSETDLIDKNREYRATPSIQRYVVLQQTHKAAIVFVRRTYAGSHQAAYDTICRVLGEHGFQRQQRSLYFGKKGSSAITCVLAVQDLQKRHPWFRPSVGDIRMMRIEELNDLYPALGEPELSFDETGWG
jgi:virulence-associated protein VapD